MWWIIALAVLFVVICLWEVVTSETVDVKPEVKRKSEIDGSYEHCIPKPDKWSPEPSLVKFPDGSEKVVAKWNYTPQLQADLDSTDSWTPPMKELFLLLVKDWRNWEVVYDNSILQHYSHKGLGISLEYDFRRRCGESWVCSLSIRPKDVQRVVDLAKVWKRTFYARKLYKLDKIKEIRNKRILLENQQKEATMITQYLENKGK